MSSLDSKKIELFNNSYPYGSSVYLLKDGGTIVHTFIVSEAWAVAPNSILVRVLGVSGGYAIDRIFPDRAEKFSASQISLLYERIKDQKFVIDGLEEEIPENLMGDYKKIERLVSDGVFSTVIDISEDGAAKMAVIANAASLRGESQLHTIKQILCYQAEEAIADLKIVSPDVFRHISLLL